MTSGMQALPGASGERHRRIQEEISPVEQRRGLGPGRKNVLKAKAAPNLRMRICPIG
jgi:hypothetical protein